MPAITDLIADLAEEHCAGKLDGQGFAAALLRRLPALARLSVEQLEDADDELGYQRLDRRNEALQLVLAELALLDEPTTAASVRTNWKRFVRSSVADGWRQCGGPSRDANQLDARLFHLHLHNRGEVLGERQLTTLVGELWPPAKPLKDVSGTLPSSHWRSRSLGPVGGVGVEIVPRIGGVGT